LINGCHSLDYKLEISTNKIYGDLEFIIISIGKQTKKKVPRAFPIRVLPLLRDGMAKLLVEFDGTQQIGPSTIPKWNG